MCYIVITYFHIHPIILIRCVQFDNYTHPPTHTSTYTVIVVHAPKQNRYSLQVGGQTNDLLKKSKKRRGKKREREEKEKIKKNQK